MEPAVTGSPAIEYVSGIGSDGTSAAADAAGSASGVVEPSLSADPSDSVCTEARTIVSSVPAANAAFVSASASVSGSALCVSVGASAVSAAGSVSAGASAVSAAGSVSAGSSAVSVLSRKDRSVVAMMNCWFSAKSVRKTSLSRIVSV